MLLRARFQQTGVYPDAESYCFFKWAEGVPLAAETYPKSNTKPALLVAIGRRLVQYVTADANDEHSIIENLKHLMDKLETELSNDNRKSNQIMEGTK